MKKFEKLSRAEMKNVKGGYVKICSIVCDPVIHCGHPDPTECYVKAQVPDCSDTSLAVCSLGGAVISCTC